MAKFIYRMQNILDIKLKLESQAKIAYSQANAALREEEAKLLKLFERKNAYDNRAKELVEGKIDLLEIKTWASLKVYNPSSKPSVLTSFSVSSIVYLISKLFCLLPVNVISSIFTRA